jgi:hypothetical protein
MVSWFSVALCGVLASHFWYVVMAAPTATSSLCVAWSGINNSVRSGGLCMVFHPFHCHVSKCDIQISFSSVDDGKYVVGLFTYYVIMVPLLTAGSQGYGKTANYKDGEGTGTLSMHHRRREACVSTQGERGRTTKGDEPEAVIFYISCGSQDHSARLSQAI